ncbi:HpcH/HpaI aldolase/citrate lyase family protein [Pseudomonas sp. 21LCFQ02]|uniref:aldolase/citrate lyase family protein n=1 Tax=unclassified Pseudomonas TaxID=196821 RepID=UPI0004F72CE3|nr:MULTISPECIES: HpcH/HpaI aldolase/citrate lyase family protein [unclassified Pseudomonas]MCO8164942.1 HpcH/HpaI aldolase/citrate lyase family protein [Pseudomonas sp. 21LCFQ010]MCO8169438.1 HpcH/HpaI aldolase/citrate lyase family protein [Pseudomonas sp. 21LCFQ02]BAP45266.1 2-dehydro-3-deoxyglucarate aldolase [Pseudomonas sp. StFLB209]
MNMPINRFKAALASGAPQYGIWAGFASGYAAEITAGFGYDWMLIDGEHAPNTVPSILAQLQAVAPYSSAPVVRAVSHDPVLIKQLLDIGVQTLMIPMVESAEQARALVQATRYPPHGIRGVGGGLTRATRWDAVPDYINTAHQQLCLIVQVESRAGIENAAAIAAVDGVDAVFIGPADLSTGLGHVGNPSHPEVQEKIRSAIDATRAAGKLSGILAPAEQDARRYQDWGCQFIAVGIDISLMRQAALANLARYRQSAEPHTASKTY